VETRQETLLHHVPDDALLLLEVEDALGFHAKLKDGSVLWPDLQRIDWASHLDGISSNIDSLFAPLYAMHPDSSISYVLSLHPSGQENFGWMLTASIGNAGIEELLKRTQGYSPSGERQYNGSSIYSLKGEDAELFTTLRKDILHLSNSSFTIERVLRSESGKMMQDKEFARSYATRGKHSLAHVHANWANFPSVLRSLIPLSEDAHMDDNFAGWATSDILSDANSIYIHGLVQVSDSSGHQLASYRTQGEGSYRQFLDLCPSNTASFSYQHLSRHKQMYTEDTPVDDSLVVLLDTGYLRGHLESDSEEDAREFHLIAIKDSEQFTAWVASHSESKESLLGETLYTNLDCSSLNEIYARMGKSMKACVYNDHLILSSSITVIKDILLHQQTGRTLTTDEHFMQLNDDMDDEAALCHYMNIARTQGQINRLASEDLKASLGVDPTSLQQFQALVIQYAPASDGLFHQNILLRHNPIYKKETSSLWELEMDTLINGPFHILKNHYTKQFELLTQDSRQDLHLIDNTGRILWTVSLNEAIRSDVRQVDLYKNGKLQMAFNTDTRFYILDRNGKALDGFPVTLSDSASSRLSVMDYDNKRKYRFLIATKDGMLHNYDKEGKKVKGWKFEQGPEPIIGELQHFQIGKKDFISAIGQEGSLRFLERNGKVRYSASEKPLSDYDGGAYRIAAAKKIGESLIIYTDREGRLISSQVDGPFKVIEEAAMTELSVLSDYLIHEDSRTLRINQKGEEKMRIEHELAAATSYPELLRSDYLGLADQETRLYYLYDVSGKLVEGFPLPGNHAIIRDMNADGTLDIILWDESNVSMYSLSGK
jgi:hypothetical protein